MASSASIFFAGVGSTFAILGIGFGGGLFVAKSALTEPPAHHARVAAQPAPVRVILPSTAEAAQPPEAAPKIDNTPTSAQSLDPQLAPEPGTNIQAGIAKQVDHLDARKDEEERRQRKAERKAKRLVAERAKRQENVSQRERKEAPLMAFGGDDGSSRPFVGFFGNN
jgi:hypothetical protein